jgi:tetratricopeptide (TPR) repeat protein
VDYLAMLGRFDEAMPQVEVARDLDPLSMIIREGKAYILMLARRYDDATAVYSELVELDPSYYKAYTSLGRVYIQSGRYIDAIRMLQKGRLLAGDVPSILGALGQAYGLAGKRKEALGILAELKTISETRPAPCVVFALIHLGLGDHQKALDYLESSAKHRHLQICAIKVHPTYDPLRGEPRFQSLISRIGFNED